MHKPARVSKGVTLNLDVTPLLMRRACAVYCVHAVISVSLALFLPNPNRRTEPMMKITRVQVRMFPMSAFALVLGFVLLLSAGCGGSDVAANNTTPKPANVAIAAKPTEPEVKQADPKPGGREIKAADGPAMKSVIPPDDAILGGVLNDIAVSLPKPEYPADAKGGERHGYRRSIGQ